ncbi:MAG: hypothetical protein K2I35_06710 [Duncaniella sp.]|nr:hypothetical protein [Duncaniella sp.]
MKKYIVFTILFLFLAIRAQGNDAIADSVNVTLMNGIPAVEVKMKNLGTIHVGNEVDASILLTNHSKHRLEIEDLVVSDRAMKIGVSQSWMIPEMTIAINGYVKFTKPIGKFRITAKVYYKGVKKPTIVVYEGNVVK